VYRPATASPEITYDNCKIPRIPEHRNFRIGVFFCTVYLVGPLSGCLAAACRADGRRSVSNKVNQSHGHCVTAARLSAWHSGPICLSLKQATVASIVDT